MELILFKARLDLFNNTNVTTDNTTGNDLSPEMKTYYSDYLIDMAEPELVHDQFGQKRPIPKNGGKTIEFRKYTPLAKALTPLTEGVTPNGQNLDVSTITATVAQYGGYIELSDVLLLTAIDNNLVEATKLLGSQAGRTLDTITRDVLAENTNVMYANGAAGYTALAATDVLTVADVKKAVRALKQQNAPKINGWYVGIINPDCAYDLMNDQEWKYPHQYVDTQNIYEGEIGSIAGVRFVETTEAKVYGKGKAGKPAGTSATNSATAVYITQFIGENAYGVTDVAGGGLQHIVKQLGSAGTADPLNQRATVGWKAIKTAEMLVPQYMVSVLSGSTFGASVTDSN